MPTTIRQVCTDALFELGVIGLGESLSADLGQVALGKLQRLLNNWNADRQAVYAAAFLEGPLTPSLSPHTIGPTGTFVTDQRPVTIDGAYLVLAGSSPATNLPITIRDVSWWLNQSVPDLTSTLPTDLYYAPDWPNGSLYFWPVPTTANVVGLMARVLLDDTITLAQSFSLPPGYQDAVTLTLAEDLAAPLGKELPRTTAEKARQARARIFANNETTPRLVTADAGMQASSGTRADFNWLTGHTI